MTRLAWVLALLPLAGACNSLSPEDVERAELEANRVRWASLGPGSYVYAIRRLCYCAAESLGPVRVTVEEGTVVERVYVDGDEPVSEGLASAFPGVDGLFELVESALDGGAHEVDVTYDPELGVPIDLWIDYLEMAIDEELGVRVTEEVTPLP